MDRKINAGITNKVCLINDLLLLSTCKGTLGKIEFLITSPTNNKYYSIV